MNLIVLGKGEWPRNWRRNVRPLNQKNAEIVSSRIPSCYNALRFAIAADSLSARARSGVLSGAVSGERPRYPAKRGGKTGYLTGKTPYFVGISFSEVSSGGRGRRFESSHSDQIKQKVRGPLRALSLIGPRTGPPGGHDIGHGPARRRPLGAAACRKGMRCGSRRGSLPAQAQKVR